MYPITPVTAVPVDGTYDDYEADPAFGGSGTSLINGYVVYKGTGTSVNVTNLTPGVTYHVAVFEFAGAIDSARDAEEEAQRIEGFYIDHGTNYKIPGALGSGTPFGAPTIGTETVRRQRGSIQRPHR